MSHKKVGLALGSGGPRGFALVGVIRTLVKHKIPIDFIAGTSAGAIIGGAYAVRKDLADLEKLAENFPVRDFVSTLLEVRLSKGILKGTRFLTLLQSLIGNVRIEETKIPFAAVATDQETGETVVLKHGLLADAMRASSSIPIMFAPHMQGKQELLDGGVNQQVPADIVREMGAKIVIAVNLSENITTLRTRNPLTNMQRYFMLMMRALARENVKNADIVISPRVTSTSWMDNVRLREELIEEGERATEAVIPVIKKLIGREFLGIKLPH
jgi:NTE family protein